MAYEFIRSRPIQIDIDFRVFDPVCFEKLFGRPAIPAPGGGIDLHLHKFILLCPPDSIFEVTADQIKKLLNLDPHPVEGGYFRRTFTSPDNLDLPRGTRPQGTAIYYLLEAGSFSEMHMLDSDEIFHFYLGDPVAMLQLYPDGRSALFTLGPDLMGGQHVQILVPAGVWQGMRLIGKGEWALFGCTVVPGFSFDDYHNASYEELAEKWPDQAEWIRALTRS